MKDLKDLRIVCLIVSGILLYPIMQELIKQYHNSSPPAEQSAIIDSLLDAVALYKPLRGKVHFKFKNAVTLDPVVQEMSEKYSLPVNLIRAVIITESAFKVKAYSPAGAGGLMQLMPRTAAELGVKNLYCPEENIQGGSKYLAKMIKRFGSVELGLAAYNGGPGNVIKYNGIPPFKETRTYVKKVLRTKTLLKGVTHDQV
jgi:soluble lytic murein transglycosylase-like protein